MNVWYYYLSFNGCYCFFWLCLTLRSDEFLRYFFSASDAFLIYFFIFMLSKIFAKQRIGPHNIDVLSVFYGTLLGDSFLEKRSNNVRISFQQENINCEYLMWLWSFLSLRGYCTLIKPRLLFRIGKYSKKRYYYRLNSFTFSSLNFLFDEFYYRKGGQKCVPLNIQSYLTPLAFAC